MRGVDHQEVDPRLDQRLRALEPGRPDPGRGADPQPALLVLAGVRKGLRLLDVLDRDQPDQPVVGVDHEQLLDPVAVQELLGLLALDPFAHGDQPLGGHQLAHRHLGVGREADVAVGQDADQAAALALDHRDARDAVRRHQLERVGERRLGAERDRVDHHAGLELLDLAHLVGLRRGDRLRWMTPIPPCWAIAIASFASVTVSIAAESSGMPSSISRVSRVRDVDLGGQDLGMGGLEQHVVEGQRLSDRDRRPLHH